MLSKISTVASRRGGARFAATLTGMGTTYMWSKLKAVQAEKGSQAVGGQIELLTKLSKMMDRFVARQRQFHKQEHALSLSDSQSLPWLVGLANLMKSETNRRLHDMYNDDSTDLAANGLKIFGTAKSEALKLRPWLPVADAACKSEQEVCRRRPPAANTNLG